MEKRAESGMARLNFFIFHLKKAETSPVLIAQPIFCHIFFGSLPSILPRALKKLNLLADQSLKKHRKSSQAAQKESVHGYKPQKQDKAPDIKSHPIGTQKNGESAARRNGQKTKKPPYQSDNHKLPPYLSHAFADEARSR
jgi:hypothetical protein